MTGQTSPWASEESPARNGKALFFLGRDGSSGHESVLRGGVEESSRTESLMPSFLPPSPRPGGEDSPSSQGAVVLVTELRRKH